MFGFSSVYSIGFFILLALTPVIVRVSNNTTSPKLFRVLVLFVIMAFFSCFRAPTVGGDLEYYVPHFEEMCQVRGFSGMFDLSKTNYEPGYTLFCWLLSRITHSTFLFLAVTGLLSLVGPFALCKRYSPWPFFSILVYFLFGYYTNTFNNVRQSLALSIVFLAIPYIFEKKFFPFLFMSLLAGSFHFSAVLFIIAYPLARVRLTPVRLFTILGVSFVLSGVIGTVLFRLLGGLLASKYDEIEGAGRVMLLFYFVVTTTALYVYRANEGRIIPRRRKIAKLLINFLMAATIIQMFSVYFSSVLRLTYYFFIPVVALIPILIIGFKGNSLKSFFGFAVIVLMVLYMGFLIYAYSPEIGSNSQGVIPYKFIFS